MRLSRSVLVGVALIGILLLVGLGATVAWGSPGWLSSPLGTPGMMGPPSHPTCEPGHLGTMGGNQPCPWPSGTPGMGHPQVEMVGSMYHPMMLRVPRGTTVTWINEDDVSHSVTFRNGMADSGLLREGQTFQYTFQTAGTYQYYCSVHSSMQGAMTVTP